MFKTILRSLLETMPTIKEGFKKNSYRENNTTILHKNDIFSCLQLLDDSSIVINALCLSCIKSLMR